MMVLGRRHQARGSARWRITFVRGGDGSRVEARGCFGRKTKEKQEERRRGGDRVGWLRRAAAVAALALTAVLPESAALAVTKPPALHGVHLPPAAPQDYWICVRRAENGSCTLWKTCIKWQGGTCEKWAYISDTGWVYCGVRGCPWVHGRAYDLGERPSVEALADKLERVQVQGRADRVSRTGESFPGYRLGLMGGFVEFADGRRPHVRVVIAAGPGGEAILVRASSQACGPEERAALAAVAEWAFRSASSRAVWRAGGCAVIVSHRHLEDWLRRLLAAADVPRPDGHGGEAPHR